MSEQGEQSGGEIRLPKMIIPLGVDAGEIEVYLETLKNSSMVKGRDGSGGLLPTFPNAPSTNQSDPSGSTGNVTNLEALVSGIRIDLAETNRLIMGVSDRLEALVVKIDG